MLPLAFRLRQFGGKCLIFSQNALSPWTKELSYFLFIAARVFLHDRRCRIQCCDAWKSLLWSGSHTFRIQVMIECQRNSILVDWLNCWCCGAVRLLSRSNHWLLPIWMYVYWYKIDSSFVNWWQWNL
jgi:hypothetical protein